MKVLAVVTVLTASGCLGYAQSDPAPVPSGANMSVETGDALDPLRGRISQAWEQWQTVQRSVNDTLTRISDPCAPRIESEIKRLSEAMQKYFDAQLVYTQAWGRYAKSIVDKQRSAVAGQAAKIKQLQEAEEIEQRDLDALHERLAKLPKGAAAQTEDVRQQAAELEEQIKTIKGDLEATVKLELATQQEATVMQELFDFKAQTIEKRETAVKVARGLWEATYRNSLQSYASKCRLAPQNVALPKPPAK